MFPRVAPTDSKDRRRDYSNVEQQVERGEGETISRVSGLELVANSELNRETRILPTDGCKEWVIETGHALSIDLTEACSGSSSS